MKWQQIILWLNTFIFPLTSSIMGHGSCWTKVHDGALYARLGLQPAKTPSTVLAKKQSPSGLPFLKFGWTCFATKPPMAKILPQIGPSHPSNLAGGQSTGKSQSSVAFMHRSSLLQRVAGMMITTVMYWSGTEFVKFCVHLVLSVLTIKLLVLEGAKCENK